MDQPIPGPRHGDPSRRRARVLLSLLLLLPVACVLGTTAIGPQDWSTSRGPVVPHDRFPSDCRLCHVGDDWHGIREDFAFDHEKETGVALEGAHRQAECLRCHNDRGPVAHFAAKGCPGCHVDVHERQLGTNCKDCHDEVDWRPREQIARHGRTRFPLIGSHAATACFRCHPGAQVGNFRRADIRCESCHQIELQRATNPDHASLGWTRDCARCHRPTTWSAGGFSHDIFPLVGQHRSADCTACHQNNVFRGTPRDCVSCHRTEYDRTSRPNHAGAAFSTQCQTCHTPISWTGAGFLHRWPLTGRHAALACAECHQGNVYQGTPTACAGCHQTDYDSTTNPNHASAHFPTTCEICHNTTRWTGATFNHRFPIQGNHNVACTVCHTQPTDYRVFDCLVCHDHNKTKMDDKHSGTPGYSYTSAACYQCHPNGKH